MKRTGGITVMEEQVTSWTLLNATQKYKRSRMLFENIPPENFLGGPRCREGVLFRRPPPYIFA